ncbi:MAG: crossover junction endodeoxyribonuclease RuvC [Rhodospirillaceae bacterium]|nr:MAG: crossover junction endodeoxyribonuclease RuvC [Rhodospirillaceae bacterium]
MRSWPNSAAKARPVAHEPARGLVRILGLDPGLRHTGWGIVDAIDNRLQFIAEGVIEPDSTLALAERLRLIFTAVQNLIVTHTPGECAIEDTFVNQNPVSTLKLGHARAAAMLAAAVAGLPVSEYKPNLVKKSVVGAGHADKAQISAMVRILLPGSCATADAADALAVAISHAHLRATAVRQLEGTRTAARKAVRS